MAELDQVVQAGAELIDSLSAHQAETAEAIERAAEANVDALIRRAELLDLIAEGDTHGHPDL